MASFLDNVVLEDFDFILEGEQAREYLDRKNDREFVHDYLDRSRTFHRVKNNTNTLAKVENGKANKEEIERGRKQLRQLRHDSPSAREIGKRIKEKKATLQDYSSIHDALDAMDRHDRRHPKKESTFFNDVELI